MCQRLWRAFFTNSFGNLETSVVSHPQDLQELFKPKNNILDAPGAANKIFTPHVGENSLIVQDRVRHQRQLMMPPFHGEKMLNYGQQKLLKWLFFFALMLPATSLYNL